MKETWLKWQILYKGLTQDCWTWSCYGNFLYFRLVLFYFFLVFVTSFCSSNNEGKCWVHGSQQSAFSSKWCCLLPSVILWPLSYELKVLNIANCFTLESTTTKKEKKRQTKGERRYLPCTADDCHTVMCPKLNALAWAISDRQLQVLGGSSSQVQMLCISLACITSWLSVILLHHH